MAVDVSNYTGPLDQPALAAWRQLGITSVIVQAIAPPAGFPPGVTQQQIEACTEAGLAVEAYVYLWTADPAGITRQLDLLRGMGVDRVWLDCEDTTAATPKARIAAIRSGLQQIEARGFEVGIYTGRWWWTAYVANTDEFAHYPLWASIYDGIPDRAVGFVPFGGWTSVAIKQYSGTSSLAGVGGIDLDVR